MSIPDPPIPLSWFFVRAARKDRTPFGLAGAVYHPWRPPPRLPRSPPPPKPLPPPLPSRGAIGRASFTVTDRPSKSAPLNFVFASASSFSFVISTNQKPLLRSV